MNILASIGLVISLVFSNFCYIDNHSLSELNENIFSSQQVTDAFSIKENGISEYSYAIYSNSKYASFTTPKDYEYQTIFVDRTGSAAPYYNAFVDNIDKACEIADEMYEKISDVQFMVFLSIFLTFTLSESSFLTSAYSYELTSEIEELAIQLDGQLRKADVAFSFLYRHRVTSNEGCVTIDGQEICPMNI